MYKPSDSMTSTHVCLMGLSQIPAELSKLMMKRMWTRRSVYENVKMQKKGESLHSAVNVLYVFVIFDLVQQFLNFFFLSGIEFFGGGGDAVKS